MKEYKDLEDYMMNIEKDKDEEATVLFKPFPHNSFILKKSYLIKREDILAASIIKKQILSL